MTSGRVTRVLSKAEHVMLHVFKVRAGWVHKKSFESERVSSGYLGKFDQLLEKQ